MSSCYGDQDTFIVFVIYIFKHCMWCMDYIPTPYIDVVYGFLDYVTHSLCQKIYDLIILFLIFYC